MKVAARAKIKPFEVMEAFREAERLQTEGKDILHLSLGQPGTPPPREVKEALINAIEQQPLGYTDARGILPLRQKISEHYKKRYKVTVPAEQIFITIGSSSALLLSLLAAFDAGDKIALARPCYPAYPNILKAMDLETVFIDTDESTSFQPTLEQIKRCKDLKGIILSSPSNPTGTMLHEKEMKDIAEYADAEHIRIISDEIYHGVTYGKKASTMAKFSEHAIVTNSFSKYFLLPGWRLGWAVVPESMVRVFESLSQNFFISPPAPSQIAALHVFDHTDYLDKVVKTYADSREILISELSEAGLKGLGQSEGAFYLYANISLFSNDSRTLCERMLKEIGVCAVPGTDFDEENGNSYIRLSYCGKPEEVRQAGRRLATWLKDFPRYIG
ncbi:MAG: aminotransferase class I/II-fold pyridoxal phosphate-dependent enzyme [Rickettsiales bacterium]